MRSRARALWASTLATQIGCAAVAPSGQGADVAPQAHATEPDPAVATRSGLTGRATMPLAPWILPAMVSHGGPVPEAGLDATAAGSPASTAAPSGDPTVRRALRGQWSRRTSWTDRDGTHVQRECVLDVMEQSADEQCTDTFTPAPGAPSPCGRPGRSRIRVTSVTYRWAVSAGDVQFTPGAPNLVEDTSCETAEADAFPVMRGHWDGAGERLDMIGTSQSSGVAPVVYVRRL